MNNKQRKLLTIRYKNIEKKKYPAPKWKFKTHGSFCRWINIDYGSIHPIEDSWVVVFPERARKIVRDSHIGSRFNAEEWCEK